MTEEKKKVGFQVDDEDENLQEDQDQDEGKKTSSTGDKDGEKGRTDAGSDDDGDDDKPLYTKKDVSNMIKGRLADDRYRKIVEKIAARAGISIDQMEHRLNEIDQIENQKKIQSEAKKLNVDPMVLQALAHLSAQNESLMMRDELREMVINKKDYPGIDDKDLQDKVIQKAKERNIPLKEAYWIVAGQSMVKQVARETEHRLENERQKNAGKDRVQGDESSSFGTSGEKIPDEVVAMAKKIGEDPQEYWDAMQSKDIDQWRERRAKRKANKK